MSTVPMSGTTYNILLHSMLNSKACQKLGRVYLSRMPPEEFIDVCIQSLGVPRSQDKKRQDFFELLLQSEDVLSWWSATNDTGSDCGVSIAVRWERFLAFIPNDEARYLKWDLERHLADTGSYPINRQSFIIKKLNDSLGKCKVLCDTSKVSKKAVVPKVNSVKEPKVQKAKAQPMVQQGAVGQGTVHPHPLVVPQVGNANPNYTVGYAGQNHMQNPGNGNQQNMGYYNKYPEQVMNSQNNRGVCNICGRGNFDGNGCMANDHRSGCYTCRKPRESPAPGCTCAYHSAVAYNYKKPFEQSGDKKLCRLCGSNTHDAVSVLYTQHKEVTIISH